MTRTLRQLWRLVINTYRLGRLGVQIAAPYALAYLVILIIAWALAVVVPGGMMVLGAVTGTRWLIATAGLMWILAGTTVLVLSTPLGLVLTGIFRGLAIRGTGDAWVRVATWTLMAGAVTAMALVILPVRNAPHMIPVWLLGLAVLGLATALGWTSGNTGRKVIIWSAGLLLVLGSISFLLPKTSEATTEKAEKVDGGLAKFISELGPRELQCGASGTMQEQFLTLPDSDEVTVVVPDGCWESEVLVRPAGTPRFSGYPDSKIEFRVGVPQSGGGIKWEPWTTDFPGNTGLPYLDPAATQFQYRNGGTEPVKVTILLKW